MANKKIIEKKQNVVNEITQNVKESSSVVFCEYSTLTVSEMTDLRRKLRENAADIKVYKNTLTRRALDSIGFSLSEELIGQKAMIFGKDAVMPIKIISEFAKKHPALEMKVGIVEGNVATIDTLKALSNLPSREGLLTMVASGLMGVVRDFAICVDLHRQNLEEK